MHMYTYIYTEQEVQLWQLLLCSTRPVRDIISMLKTGWRRRVIIQEMDTQRSNILNGGKSTLTLLMLNHRNYTFNK
jgi:hypothetical protein